MTTIFTTKCFSINCPKINQLNGLFCKSLREYVSRNFINKPGGIEVLAFQNTYKLHTIIRKKSDFKYKYSAEVEAAVNKQIQAEQQAAQDYLNIAVAFLHPSQSRPGAGGFFMRMFDEEIGHMQDFVHYQLLRGGIPIISGLKAPTPNMKITLLQAFQKGLEMEKHVTLLLEDVVKVAESAKDYQAADFVTSVFLEEQMHSVSEMSHHVSKLSKLCDEHALYHYDVELSKNYPWAYKRKAPG